MVESAASPIYHRYLNALAAGADVLTVFVEYRHAPEQPLVTAYDDSWAVTSTSPGSPEPWLAVHGEASREEHADNSAGTNIVQSVDLRTTAEGLPHPCAAICGLLLVDPYFWDATNAMAARLEARICRDWWLVCMRPNGKVHDLRICPMCAEATPQLAALPCKRVMVVVACDDFLAAEGRERPRREVAHRGKDIDDQGRRRYARRGGGGD